MPASCDNSITDENIGRELRPRTNKGARFCCILRQTWCTIVVAHLFNQVSSMWPSGRVWSHILAYGGHGGKGCRCDVGGKAPPLREKVKMEVERWEKILGWVTLGGESESDVGVGVTLEGG